VHSDSEEEYKARIALSNRQIEMQNSTQYFRELNSSSSTSRQTIKPSAIKVA